MFDRREAILARLVEIATGIEGIAKVYRNKDEIPEKSRPAIVIWDADESADDSDPTGRPVGAPRRVGMTPEIYILLGSSPEDIGTSINLIRSRVIAAIYSDATLKGLTVNGEGIRYEGCATALSRGRSMEGEMGLSFTFTYLLSHAELLDVTA